MTPSPERKAKLQKACEDASEPKSKAYAFLQLDVELLKEAIADANAEIEGFANRERIMMDVMAALQNRLLLVEGAYCALKRERVLATAADQ